MKMQKYAVNQQLIEHLLAWVTSGEIAIPEIQRPFVWDASKVRDLMDSLYQGYPVGYIIAWRNPDVRLKDGSTSSGKKVLIDGQQRITALTAAVLGQQVVNKHYKKVRIKIAFDPQNEAFAVQTPVIRRDKKWIPDIAPLLSGELKQRKVERDYIEANPEANEDEVFNHLDALCSITKKQIGVIELDSDLDIDTVTEIFIRINSKGVVLSQADFAMSKIAANEIYGGAELRKTIDYFCHLAIGPGFYDHIETNDAEFAASDAFAKIRWLRHETDDLYDPEYTDMLRVAFTSEFSRGKLADLVSLLSGRNFEQRTFEEEIAEASFARLQKGVLNFVNETNFKRFLMIIRSAGFVDKKLIRSMNVPNFAYVIYLKLRSEGYNAGALESAVRRWFVMSMLTRRYSGSPETTFDYDIRGISEKGFDQHLADVEAAQLGEAFWVASLPQGLNTSAINSPYFHVFMACQTQAGDKGFLSRDVTVRDMLLHRGDIHHIFPKAYLMSQGLTRSMYNQIANFCYMQQEINIKVGNKPPAVYMAELQQQIATGELLYGSITTQDQLAENLSMSCVPAEIVSMDIADYPAFLEQRRTLIAARIRSYYESL